MKLATAISTTVLSLTLGLAASAYAQEQHEQKEEEKAKPAQQDEKKTSPHKPSKSEKKAAEKQQGNAGHEEKATEQQNKDAKPEDSKARQQPQHAEQAQPEQHAKGDGDHRGGRIPEDRYRAHFGQEHRFHVNQADYGRDRRFQYGGYTFGFVDVWPSNWLYTQDVFVVEIDGVYYLCNPTYPGVNVALSVVL